MKRISALFLLLFCLSASIFAQGNTAKADSLYRLAEQAFAKQDFISCLNHIKQAETALEATMPQFEFLRARSYYNRKEYPAARKAVARFQEFEEVDTGLAERMNLFVSKMEREAVEREKKRKEEEMKQQAETEAKKVDEDAWKEATIANTIASYQTYLAASHKKWHEVEAKKAVDNLKKAEEKAAYDKAASKETAEAYKAFLESYPSGLYASQAKAAITRLEREAHEAFMKDQQARYEKWIRYDGYYKTSAGKYYYKVRFYENPDKVQVLIDGEVCDDLRLDSKQGKNLSSDLTLGHDKIFFVLEASKFTKFKTGEVHGNWFVKSVTENSLVITDPLGNSQKCTFVKESCLR